MRKTKLLDRLDHLPDTLFYLVALNILLVLDDNDPTMSSALSMLTKTGSPSGLFWEAIGLDDDLDIEFSQILDKADYPFQFYMLADVLAKNAEISDKEKEKWYMVFFKE